MYKSTKKTDKTQSFEGKKSSPATRTEFNDNRQTAIKHKEIQKIKQNKTGLPDTLKTGIENLSGISMDDVKVHYNSDKPAQLQANAYAQGTDIHLGSGQEKHLPHEAWHVVQQKQGRVKPTIQMKGKISINDDAGLEKEADVMGEKATQSVGDESGISQKKMQKPGHKTTLQRVFKVGETTFSPDMVYRFLTAHITGLKNLISKEELKQAIVKKCETQDGKQIYSIDKESAWGLLTELFPHLKEMKLEEQRPLKVEHVGQTDIGSLITHLKEQHDPVKAFREYMYDPAVFYEKTGVNDEVERLLDSTRRKVETLIAGELLEAAAKTIEITTYQLISSAPNIIMEMVKLHGGDLKVFIKSQNNDDGPYMNTLYDILLGKEINPEVIVHTLKGYPFSDQISQFLSAFELFERDKKEGKYTKSAVIVENILKNLAMIQIVNWMAPHLENYGMGSIYDAVLNVYKGTTNPSYGVGRGRIALEEDKKDNTMTYPVKERGLTFDSHLKKGASKKMPDQMLEHSIFSAAGNSLPGELARKEDTPNLTKRFKNPGWLERARKHNQPFVNSVSGICLMFRNIQEMYKKSISGNDIKPPGKKEWHQMEALLSAAIVYYPGGHTFHECIKGFKAGGQIKVDASKIKPEEHLKWKEFCFSQDFIPDIVIHTCMQKLDIALKTQPDEGKK